jgi:DNA-binding transcriptional regulator YbjK
MTTTRDRALEAAVGLVGTQGLRALTHVRVDERAGLPRGSTSNHFRTRAALLNGVVGWLAERELADFDPGFNPETASADDLIDVLCALIEAQTGAFRTRTMARYVLFLESARDPAVQAPLLENRRRFEQVVIGMVSALGAPNPESAARAVMACAEGLVLHRMTVDQNAELRPSVAVVVLGCLTAA